MRGRVRLERVTGHTTDELGTRHPVWSAIHEGPGQVVVASTIVTDTDSAGRPVTVTTYFARLPIHVAAHPQDRLVVLESDDPRLAGVEFTVRADETEDLAVVRILRLSRTN